ncbi:MAG: hypothetical protein AB7Q81_03540 [Gammaproteobacteria bacterium]
MNEPSRPLGVLSAIAVEILGALLLFGIHLGAQALLALPVA